MPDLGEPPGEREESPAPSPADGDVKKTTPPVRIGRYPVVGELGGGGQGVVFLAEDPTIPRHIAIKILPPQIANQPAALDRLRREAQLLGSINHPNIATLYSWEETDGLHFITMEVVKGCKLSERIAAGPLELGETLRICRQVLAALETAHGKGIIHRDLKPSNIMITGDGQVKVLDFGLAKRGIATSADSSTPGSADPAASGILGTPGYASPEQLSGEELDDRTDIWSFGCVMYECLAGDAAFRGHSAEERLAATLSLEPDWSRLPHDLPEGVRPLLARCLAKDPADRFRSAAEVRPLVAALVRQIERAHEESAEARKATAGFWTWVRSSRGLRVGSSIVAATVLVFAMWRMAMHAASSRATYDVAGATITGRPWLLGKRWSVQHDTPIRIHRYGPWQSPRTVVYGLEAGGTEGGNVYVRDLVSGRLLWEARPDFVEIEEVFGPDRALQGSYACCQLLSSDITGDGEQELLVYCRHERWGSAYIAVYDGDGRRRGAYYNHGLLYDILTEDIDGDGKAETLAAGTNNKKVYEGATVILLDERHCWGAAVDSLVNPHCALGDSSLARVVFPNYDPVYMDLVETPRLVAYDLAVARSAGGRVRITCSVGSESAPHVIELDGFLAPVSISPSDCLRAAVRTWPQERQVAFLSTEYAEAWLSRHYLFGTLHRDSRAE